MNLQEWRTQINQTLTEYRLAEKRVEEEKKALRTITKRLCALEEALSIVQDVAQVTQNRVQARISPIVSRCLQIFEEKEWIYVKRDSLPDPIIYGVSKVPGRIGWVILEMDEGSGMDQEKGKLSGRSKPEKKRSGEIISNRQPGTSSVRRSTSSRDGMLPRSRPRSDKQQSDESSMGDSYRKHDGSKETRKRSSSQDKPKIGGRDAGEVPHRDVHTSGAGGSIRSVIDRNSPPHRDRKDLVRVKVAASSYSFHIAFEQKRGKTEARLVFTKEGMEIDDPRDESGGGVVDVASFALRLACLLLSKNRRFLVFDEPFTHLHGKEYQEKMGELLVALAEEKGVQMLLASDESWLKKGRVYEL